MWWDKYLKRISERERIRDFLKIFFDRPYTNTAKLYVLNDYPFHPIYFNHHGIHRFDGDGFMLIERLDFGLPQDVRSVGDCKEESYSFLSPRLSVIVRIDYDINLGNPTILKYQFIDPKSGRKIRLGSKREYEMMDTIREMAYIYSCCSNALILSHDDVC